MGGKSKSSNQTQTTTNTTNNTTNVSGTAATSGDNNGVMLSGVNDSNINVTMTDHGAVEKAAELGELALSSNVEVSTAALEMGEKAIDSSLGFGEKALDGALSFGEKALASNADVSNNAMELVTDAHGENLQMMAGLAGNQAAQNAENLGAIKELAEMKIDGGQVATSKQMTIVVSVIVFMLAVVFIMRGRK